MDAAGCCALLLTVAPMADADGGGGGGGAGAWPRAGRFPDLGGALGFFGGAFDVKKAEREKARDPRARIARASLSRALSRGRRGGR